MKVGVEAERRLEWRSDWSTEYGVVEVEMQIEIRVKVEDVGRQRGVVINLSCLDLTNRNPCLWKNLTRLRGGLWIASPKILLRTYVHLLHFFPFIALLISINQPFIFDRSDDLFIGCRSQVAPLSATRKRVWLCHFLFPPHRCIKQCLIIPLLLRSALPLNVIHFPFSSSHSVLFFNSDVLLLLTSLKSFLNPSVVSWSGRLKMATSMNQSFASPVADPLAKPVVDGFLSRAYGGLSVPTIIIIIFLALVLYDQGR